METPPPSAPITPSPSPAPEEKQWIIATHISALAGMLIPFGNILGPLVVWLFKKSEFPVLEPVGRAVLNFQISWTIYAIVAGLSILVCIGWLLLPALFVAWLVFVIIATVKASNGEPYTYPLTIKFL